MFVVRMIFTRQSASTDLASLSSTRTFVALSVFSSLFRKLEVLTVFAVLSGRAGGDEISRAIDTSLVENN